MTTVDALAGLRDGARWQCALVDRPRRYRLDDDGCGLTVEIPGPRVLARTYVAETLRVEVDLFRAGGAFLERPRGTEEPPLAVPLAEVRDRLLEALQTLPERPDAGRPYRDLVLFVRAGRPDTVSAYLDDVLRSLRSALPVWRAKAAPAPRGPAQTAGERKAAQRARDRVAEEATAAWALRRWYDALDDPEALDEDRPPVGQRLKIGDVYAVLRPGMEEAAQTYAEEVGWRPHTTPAERYEAWAEYAEEEDFPPVPKVPGPRTFYAVADRLLGAPKRVRGERVYTIPATLKETPRMLDEIREETAVLKTFSDEAERYLRLRAALEDQRARLTLDRPPTAIPATGTDGGARVVDLAARRAVL